MSKFEETLRERECDLWRLTTDCRVSVVVLTVTTRGRLRHTIVTGNSKYQRDHTYQRGLGESECGIVRCMIWFISIICIYMSMYMYVCIYVCGCNIYV